MVALWERMSQMFGPSWESFFGTVDGVTIAAWSDNLLEFTELELAGAVKACREWEDKFPPTFPQFRAMCMAARGAQRKNWTDERVDREVRPVKELVRPRQGDSEVARIEKARIARIQAGEEVETREESMRRLGLQRR